MAKVFEVSRGVKTETSREEVETFLHPYKTRVLDVGAGDAKGSLRYARENQEVAVVALDLSWDALNESSKVAAKKPSRGGTPNIMFICANAFDIAGVIDSQIDLIRIYLPWGDLLEGLAENNERLLTSLASTLRKSAELEIVINSEIWRENLPNHLNHIGEITPEFFEINNSVLENFGFTLKESRLLTMEEIENLDTTWSAKLMSSRITANFVMAKAVYQKIV